MTSDDLRRARVHRALAERGQFCVGIDPHAALLAAVGARPTTSAGLETVRARRGRGGGARTSRSSSRSRRSTSGSAAAASPSSSGSSPSPARPVRWCCSTSSAATSARPRRRTPTPTSTPPRRSAADAITASPFLGFGSLDPMVETARRHGAGVFVLALTSNKEGPEVQHAVGRRRRHGRRRRARPAARAQRRRRAARLLRRRGRRHHRRDRRGPRRQRAAARARLRRPGRHPGRHAPDLRRAPPAHVLASSSREVLRLGPDPRAMTDACRRANDELAEALA